METHTQNGTMIKWRPSAYTSLSWAANKREINRASKIDAYFHFICRITSIYCLDCVRKALVLASVRIVCMYESKRLKRKSYIIIYMKGKKGGSKPITLYIGSISVVRYERSRENSFDCQFLLTQFCVFFFFFF